MDVEQSTFLLFFEVHNVGSEFEDLAVQAVQRGRPVGVDGGKDISSRSTKHVSDIDLVQISSRLLGAQ